jgi:hypothetical protein
MTEEQNTPLNIWNDFAARALRTGAPVPSVQIEFDADMARLGLAWNFSNNRKPKPHVIKIMVQSIGEGSFASGTVLRIAYDNLLNQWVLVDGQHRLSAVEASGIKQWFVVTVDSRPADIAYATLDRLGTMRNEGDSINGSLGWKTKHWESLVGAVRIISGNYSLALVGSSKNDKRPISESMILAAEIEKYKTEIIKISQLPGKDLTRSLCRAPSAAVFIVAARWQPDIFFPWAEKAIADNTIAFNSSEMRLRDLSDMPAKNYEERCRLFLASALIWNAKFHNQPMHKMPHIRWTDDIKTPFPGIAGTPYAK